MTKLLSVAMVMVGMLGVLELHSKGEARKKVGMDWGASGSSRASTSCKEEGGARSKEVGARCPAWMTCRHCIKHVASRSRRGGS